MGVLLGSNSRVLRPKISPSLRKWRNRIACAASIDNGCMGSVYKCETMMLWIISSCLGVWCVSFHIFIHGNLHWFGRFGSIESAESAGSFRAAYATLCGTQGLLFTRPGWTLVAFRWHRVLKMSESHRKIVQKNRVGGGGNQAVRSGVGCVAFFAGIFHYYYQVWWRNFAADERREEKTLTDFRDFFLCGLLMMVLFLVFFLFFHYVVFVRCFEWHTRERFSAVH